MKKHLRKMIAAAIVGVMVLGMGVTSMAAGTITVTTPTDTTTQDYSTETYKAYKIFDAVLADGSSISTSETTQTLTPDNGAVSYQISTSSPWFSHLFTVDATTGVATPVSNQTWVTATQTGTAGVYQVAAAGTNGGNLDSDTEAIAFADWLLAIAEDEEDPINPDYTLIEGANNVADGYYLISSSLGTNLGLATTNIPMTIVEKNNYPTVTKTVASTDEAAQIGQNVTFTIEVNIPQSASGAITITDTMTSGLTFNAITSVQNATGANVAYTSAPETLNAANVTANGDNGNEFSLTFADTVVAANLGGKITVVYTATVNRNAVVAASGTDANTNEVELSYQHYTQTSTVGVDTVGITLLKYDGAVTDAVENNTSLPGAVFELHDANGAAVNLVHVGDETIDSVVYDTYRVADGLNITGMTTETTVTQITTVANKVVRVIGLDPDLTYTWSEIDAPDGYNMVSSDTNASISAESTVTRTNIENNKGTVLPSTGGIGTRPFMIIGAVLVVGAAVVLVTRKRMSDR